MTPMNLTASLNFQLNQSAARTTRSQAEQIFSGIKGKVGLDIDPRAAGSLQQLNNNTVALRANLQALNTASSQASSAISRVGAAMHGVAGQARSLSSGMQSTVSSTQAVGRAAKDASSGLEDFGRAAGLAGRRLVAFSAAAGAFYGVTNAIQSGVREAVQFDLQLNRLKQTAQDSAADIADVGKVTFRLATNLGASSQEIIQAAVSFRQAGLNLRETKTALDVVAKASLAPSFRDMNQVVEGSIATFQQFSKDANKLADNIGAVNAVAAAFATEASDIITSISKAGGAASQAGGSFEELIALFTSVRSTTRESADSIATGLRTVFSRLQRNDTVEALKSLGINLRYTREEAQALGDAGLEGHFAGMYEAVRRLSEGLGKLRSTDPRFASALEELGGYRQVSRVIPLIQQFSEAQKALNVARLGSASLEAAAATRQDALATKFAKTREEFQKFVNELVQSKGFKATVDGALELANALIQVLGALKPLLPMIATIGAVKLFSGAAQFGKGFYEAFAAPTGGNSRVPQRLRFSHGDKVPGVGSGDSVHALLTPGEWVIRKSSAAKLGPRVLKHLNEHGELPRFAKGGPVLRYASGSGDFDAIFGNVYGDLRNKLRGVKRKSNLGDIDLDELVSEATIRMRESFNAGVTDPKELLNEGVRGGRNFLRKEERQRGDVGGLGFDPNERDHDIPISNRGGKTGPASRQSIADTFREMVSMGHLTPADVMDPALAERLGTDAHRALASEFGFAPENTSMAPMVMPSAARITGPTTTTALARLPTFPLASTGSGPNVGSQIPDAEYRVVQPPRGALPPHFPLALPSGPSPLRALPPHAEPDTYRLMTELPGFLPDVGHHTLLSDAKSVMKDSLPLSNPVRASYGFATGPAPTPSRRPGESADAYSARFFGDGPLPLSTPPVGAESNPYQAHTSLSSQELARRRIAKAGLHTANVGDLANLRVSGAVSAAGGPGMLSNQTLLELANKEHLKVEQELTKGIQRQLQALTPAITATEARRKAEEMAATALKEGSAVLRNRAGNVVGLQDLGEQLAAGGKNASGQGRFSNFLATRADALGRGASWLGGRMGGGVGGLVALSAAPMIGSAFDPSKEQVEAAAVTGNSGGVRRGAAVGGALSGAAMGAGVGMMFGPWGAAIGGVIGGLTGLVSSLNQAEKDIREAKVGDALTRLGDTLQAANGPGGLNAAEVKKQLDLIQTEVNAKVKDETVGTFSQSSAAETAAVRAKVTRELFGSQSGAMVNILTRQSQDIAKRSPDADAATLSKELNQSLLAKVAELRQVPLAQVLKEYAESIQASQRQIRTQKDIEKGRDAAEQTATGLIRMADALSNAIMSLSHFESALTVSGSLFSGQGGGARFGGFANGFTQLGTGTGVEFGRSSAILDGFLGESGKSTLKTAQASDQVARAMPSVLNTLGKSAIGPEENVRKRARDLLAGNLLPDVPAGDRDKALDARPELRRVVDTVVAELSRVSEESKDKGGLSKRLADNPDKVLDEVLASTKDTSQRLADMAKAVEDNMNRMVEGLTQVRQHEVAIGEARDHVATLGLGAIRASAEVQADRTGRTAGSFLSLRDLQAPFQTRQERLTGFVGDDANDPTAIANKLGQVRSQIDSVLADRTKISTKSEFDESAKKLGALTGQANNLQAALRNLTNVSERAAGIQEKLNDSNANRGGRLGYAERFIMANPEQQARMQRGQDVVAGLDRGKLDFKTLSQDEQRLALETMNDFSGVRLASGRTGAGLKEQVLGKLPGVLDPKQEAERTGLQDKLVDVAKVAESAGQALTTVLKDENGRFLTGLRSLQEQFFARLATNTAADALSNARADETRASGQRGELRREEGQKTLLAGLGITENKGLESLRNSKGDIDKYLGLTEQIRGVYSKPIASDLESGIGAATTGPGRLDDKLRAFLTGRGLETLNPEQQTESIRRIVEDYTTLPASDVNDENLGKITRRELASGRARTVAGLEQERAEPQNRLARAGVKLPALQGLGEGGRKSLDEVMKKDNPLNLDTLGERVKKSEEDLTKFGNAVKEAEERLKKLANGEGAISTGGGLKLAGGGFSPRGTDTVPAMLSPGEFVVNAKSAAANPGLLNSINNARGPMYLANGGSVDYDDPANNPFLRPIGPAPKGMNFDGTSSVQMPDPKTTAFGTGRIPAAAVYNGAVGSGATDYWGVTAPQKTLTESVTNNGPYPVNPMAPARVPMNAGQFQMPFVRPRILDAVKAPAALKNAVKAPAFAGADPFGPLAMAKFDQGLQARVKADEARKQVADVMNKGRSSGTRFFTETNRAAALLGANQMMNAQSMAYQQSLFRGFSMPGEEGQLDAGINANAHRRAMNNFSFRNQYGRDTLSLRNGLTQDARAMDFYHRNQVAFTARKKRYEEGLAKERARNPNNPNLGRNAAIGINTFITPEGGWRGAPLGFATGGVVPVAGNRDSVAAMLTPGEVVLNRSAVNGMGGPNRANALSSGGGPGPFGNGLGKELQEAIATFGTRTKELTGSFDTFRTCVAEFGRHVTTFDTSVASFGRFVEKIPTEMGLTGSFTTEVVINGAEAFAGMEEKFKQTMENYVTAKVAQEFEARMPDGPPKAKSDPSRVA